MKNNILSRSCSTELFVMLFLTWLVGAADAQTPGSNPPNDKVTKYAQLNAETSKQLSPFLKTFHLPSLSLAIRIKDEMIFVEAQGLASVADNRTVATS